MGDHPDRCRLLSLRSVRVAGHVRFPGGERPCHRCASGGRHLHEGAQRTRGGLSADSRRRGLWMISDKCYDEIDFDGTFVSPASIAPERMVSARADAVVALAAVPPWPSSTRACSRVAGWWRFPGTSGRARAHGRVDGVDWAIALGRGVHHVVADAHLDGGLAGRVLALALLHQGDVVDHLRRDVPART